jgi:hypothetical protein
LLRTTDQKSSLTFLGQNHQRTSPVLPVDDPYFTCGVVHEHRDRAGERLGEAAAHLVGGDHLRAVRPQDALLLPDRRECQGLDTRKVQLLVS